MLDDPPEGALKLRLMLDVLREGALTLLLRLGVKERVGAEKDLLGAEKDRVGAEKVRDSEEGRVTVVRELLLMP